MCLINFQYQQHSTYKLVLAANRDEFFERPTEKAHFWDDHPNVLAGRDLRQMGTWLGITKDGRIAALTNYRDPSEETDGKESRGEIVRSFLTSLDSPKTFLEKLSSEKDKYAGFNLLVGNADDLWYYSNKSDQIEAVLSGTHSLSNAFLTTSWPKTDRGKTLLEQCLNDEEAGIDCLFSLLQNDEQAPIESLPKTGVSLEWEKILSPIFINSEHYGTRASTVLIIDRENNVKFIERSYLNGKCINEESFRFTIQP
ncbi:uncharacterized protein with NRDE domain [Bacillus ectoiniformans]|uniref:NRDE family protein n=1 Tax=Bacillus ectoiniformans TaxID=1494429 RepID=UPI0019581120|nr:NRDE family protein [Bacillus ectoiniformans]MBM7647799.1 uncharacterized protein with NRDE domain [Bacillus ectoiniformans]